MKYFKILKIQMDLMQNLLYLRTKNTTGKM